MSPSRRPQGKTAAAAKAATCQRELEEIGSTLAVMGRFEAAAAFIKAQPVEDFRREGVHGVIQLEKCRRQLPGIVQTIAESGTTGSTSIALALTVRIPWGGYPFADW